MLQSGGLDLAEKAPGKHRADVEINLLESMELRSRRSIREAERKKLTRKQLREEKRLAKLDAKYQAQQAAAMRSQVAPNYVIGASIKLRWYRRRSIRSFVTMIIAAGMFTTVALPAYAFDPAIAAMAQFTTTNAQDLAESYDTQNLTVAAVSTVKYVRGKYQTTSANEILRQQILNAVRTYQGPTAADYVLNPPYSRLDPATVMKVASKLVGTPYVFGGETPSGMDCSGFVRFVYAQFGINLPHSVIEQSHYGIKIRPEDAMPGDLVIMSNLSHDGIYAGNGNFYHAPRPGDSVKLAPIFTSQVFFIRLGTK
ncbi:MAG: hypothetical protein RL670_829 [Actinomycetota bacterium]